MSATSNQQKSAYHETQSGLEEAMIDSMAMEVRVRVDAPYTKDKIILCLAGKYSPASINKHFVEILRRVEFNMQKVSAL